MILHSLIGEFDNIVEGSVLNINALIKKYNDESDPLIQDVLCCIRNWSERMQDDRMNCMSGE
jgi:hypothetical protein